MLRTQSAYSEEQIDEKEARERLIMKELPQVYDIAQRIHERLPKQMALEDLVHAGVIGLIEAVRSYDPSKSIPLKFYAKFRIRGAILDSLRQLDWGSRLLRREGRQVEDAISNLSKKLGRQPEEEEIAAELGITIEELYAVAQRIDGAILIGQQVISMYDPSEQHDLIESAQSRDENPFELCVRTEVKENLSKAIGALSEKEQLIISLYYKEELTMKEISVVMQCVESRISQLHALALPKLRATLRGTAPTKGCSSARSSRGL